MAAHVVEGMRAGDNSGRKVVDELLGRSDYDRTYPMLKEVGINMTKPGALPSAHPTDGTSVGRTRGSTRSKRMTRV